jgi:enamine deaminase RidA (YjgF/YER057c/UK114 family)
VIIEERLRAMGIELPPPLAVPPGARLPFAPVRIVGDRAIVSGHGPQNPDGSSAGPYGKVGAEVSLEEAYAAARGTAISILGDLARTLGDLDRITAWVRVFGMVASVPGFNRQPAVINGCSDLLLELFGDEVGAHARSAVGMAELPFGLPVEIEAEVAIRP